jgi:hypothetical protein
MIFETKKTFLILYVLFSLAMPLTPVYAAIGPVCGGEEREYIDALNNTRNTESQSATPGQQVPASQERTDRRNELKENMCQLKDLFTGMAQVINYLIGAIGIFIIFRIVVSGFQMVISAGNEGSIKTAKSGLSSALIGLLLVLLSYVIINTLFSLFLEDSLRFPLNPFS